ncbi:signalosome subunit 3 [Aspergillus cavernicola]|uniref:COP9 signalosome complex subunit 3 n=1 Tax=Aspergillus cavernicola TaxID=176166 RepID=A0ABR4IAC4_9EURO
MSDFLGRLSSVPSRPHDPDNISAERYDRQLRDLISYLKQPGVASSTSDYSDFFEIVSPSVHSLSFLFLLRFQIQLVQKRTKRDIPQNLHPGGDLWKQVVRFLRSFDPIQIRYAGYEWRQLVEVVASAAQAISKPALAVKVIADALGRLNTSGMFTSVHLTLVKLALLSSSYTHTLPIMDKVLCNFPTDTNHVHHETFLCSEHGSSAAFITDTSGFSTKLTYRDHLQFYLYSAMIYMALKRWDHASHCLSVVISSPTANSVSKIMVEAYKKWVLASLLGYGKLPPTSRMIAPHVTRVYQSLARPYVSLAEAFEKADLQKMSAEVDLGQSIWRDDKNTGLVSQLFEAYDKFMIIKLGRTFSALTIADVLQRAPSYFKDHYDTEEFVASLVMSDTLRATLSHLPGTESTTMLRFCLSTQFHAFREEHIRTRLMRGKSALNTIAKGIVQTDQTLELSDENLHFIARSQKWNGDPEKSGAVGSGEAGVGGDIDEDLMGDGH